MKVVCMTIAVSVAAASDSWASCDTGRSYGDGYWFDGWYRTAASIPGGSLGYVGSQILEYSPYVAPTSGAESTSAWPMIQNDDPSTLYEVYWDPNTQRLQHYINGNLVQSHVRYFTMRRADISGETHEYRSQMPGGYNAHEQLAGGYVANLGGGLYTFDGILNISNGSIHGQARGSSTRVDIWDRACAT
jgi:hypothetical protein